MIHATTQRELRGVTDRRIAERRGAPRGTADRRVACRRASDQSDQSDQVVPRSPAAQCLGAGIIVILTIGVGVVGALAAHQGMSWYHSVNRPTVRPSAVVVATVFAAVSLINAAAGYLAWRSTRRAAPTVLWSASLLLHLLWTLTFFAAHRPLLGLALVAALWASMLTFAVVAKPYDATATWLAFPYLSWITFAGLLNVAIA